MNQLTQLFFKTRVKICELLQDVIPLTGNTHTIIQDKLRSISVSLHFLPKMLIISLKFTENLQPSLLQQHLAKCLPLLWQSTTDQSIHKMKTHQQPPWMEQSSSTTAAKAMETTFVASKMFYCIQQKGTTINSSSYCGTSQHEWVSERNALSFTLQMWCSYMTMHVLTLQIKAYKFLTSFPW